MTPAPVVAPPVSSLGGLCTALNTCQATSPATIYDQTCLQQCTSAPAPGDPWPSDECDPALCCNEAQAVVAPGTDGSTPMQLEYTIDPRYYLVQTYGGGNAMFQYNW